MTTIKAYDIETGLVETVAVVEDEHADAVYANLCADKSTSTVIYRDTVPVGAR